MCKREGLIDSVHNDDMHWVNPPGHESGHLLLGSAQCPPLAFTWAHFVDQLAALKGGLAELARHLQDIAPEQARLSDDPMTVERGLRRLRSRGQVEGNKYGKLLIRLYGIPRLVADWAKEMGQYHSRSSDLSVDLRQDQLRLWDCPPLSESHSAVWIHISLASLAHRQGDLAQMERRVELAGVFLRDAGPAAQIEMALLEARIASGKGERGLALEKLGAARELCGHVLLGSDEQGCYFARIQDQEAYQVARGWRERPEKLEEALVLYEDIPEGHPFVGFRREHGRAWCLWRMGCEADALEAARLACQRAGDGGFVRFRIMSLSLQAHIVGQTEEGRAIMMRAERMARRLGDRELLGRIQRSWSG